MRLYLGILATSLILMFTVGSLFGGELEQEAISLTLKLERRFWEPGEERDRIVSRIEEIGREARVAVPALLKLLEQDNSRWSAANALKSIGGEAVPQMTAALRHENAAVRLQLCKTIAALGSDAGSAVGGIVKLLESETDLSVRREALLALGRIGGRSQLALATLHDAVGKEATVGAALAALQYFDLDAEVSIDVLLKTTKHKLPSTRLSALECLARFDRTGKHSAPALARALADRGKTDDFYGFTVSYHAATVLESLNEKALPAVPVIVELLKNEKIDESDLSVFETATRILCLDLAAAKDAVPTLQRVLRKDRNGNKKPDWFNAETQIAVASALSRIESDQSEAYKVLIDTLADDRWRRPPKHLAQFGGRSFFDPRPAAAEALGRLGPRAKDAVPLLRKALAEGIEREHNDLAAEAGWALARIDPTDKTCAAGVIKKSEHGVIWREQMQPSKIASLLQVGGDECRDNLIEWLFFFTDAMQRVPIPAAHEREFILRILQELAPDPTHQIIGRAVNCLQVSDENEHDADVATNVLNAWGPKAADAIPQLLDALKHESPVVRSNAAQALAIAGQSSASAAAALAAAALAASLDDPRAIVRARAAESLGNLGLLAKPHLSTLESATKDDYLIVRTAAKRAIHVIETAKPQED